MELYAIIGPEMLTKRSDIQIPSSVRELPRDFDGTIFVSDIDKTYLSTQIDTLGGLLKAAFESPESKQNVPGFSIVLRAARRGALEDAQKNPLYFVSASPPQIRPKLLAKMEMDGIEHDGIICKNQWGNIRKGDFKKLREQVSYKLQALLLLWQDLPPCSRLVFFGDDSESDAVIYSLFAEILAGSLEGNHLAQLLEHLGVFREDAIGISWFARRFTRPVFPVQAVFINLETGSQASYYSRFGSYVFPTDNSLQTAIGLFEMGYIRERAVRSVGRELVLHYDRSPKELLESVELGARRGLYMAATVDKLWPGLHEASVLPAYPVTRPPRDGQVTKLNPQKWFSERPRPSLAELRRRYSEEGRY